MQIAVKAHVARGISLAQSGIDLVRMGIQFQLVVEILVLGGLVGPAVDYIDVFHTCRLIMVMSSLWGWPAVKNFTVL